MLQTLRALGQSWIVKGLMLLLMGSFALWGIGDMVRHNPADSVVATVGSTRITAGDLDQAVLLQQRTRQQETGSVVQADEALRRSTLDLLINQALVDHAVRELSLKVSDKPILDFITTSPIFRTKDGTFDSQRWTQFLAMQGMNEATFLRFQRDNITRQLVLDAVRQAPPPSQVLIKTMAQALGQQRILDILKISHTKIDVPQPQEVTLRAFYDRNGLRFQKPETRDISVLLLDPKAFAKDMTPVSDADVRQAWEQDDTSFMRPERRDLVQVLVPSEEKARNLALKTQEKGGDLKTVAQSLGLQATSLQEVDDETLPDALRATVKGLPIGGVSAPVQSPLGWHVVKVTRVHPAGKQSFEVVRDRLKEHLTNARLADAVATKVNELDTALAQGSTFEDVADRLRLRIERYTNVQSDGNVLDANEGGKETSKLLTQDALKNLILTLQKGENSAVVDDGKGGYIAVRIDSINPVAVPAFESIHSDVLRIWREDEQAKRAAENAKAFEESLKKGQPISRFAKEKAVDIRLSKPISDLGARDPSLPDVVQERGLMLPEGESAVVMTAEATFVVRVADILPLNSKEVDELPALDQLTESLAQNLAYEDVDAWLNALKKRFPVKIKEEPYKEKTDKETTNRS